MSALARALSIINRHRIYGEIGLELSLEQLHMVQLCQHGESLAVHAYASVPYGTDLPGLLADHGLFAKLVKKALKQGRFNGRRVVAAMPASQTQVMPVSYQSAGSGGDDAAIARLMQERIGDGIAEFVIDYMPVQTLYEGREKLALVAICREETAVNFLELLRRSGLNIGALEIGPIAMNCGREKSYLTLLSDNRLLADDEVEFGEEAVLEGVCSALEVTRDMAEDLVCRINLDPATEESDPESARNADSLTQIIKPRLARLVQEIQRGLMFAQSESRGARTNQIYLLGSIARWPGTAQLLASLVDTPVTTVPSPLALFPPVGAAPSSEPAPELAVATGLALRKFIGNG